MNAASTPGVLLTRAAVVVGVGSLILTNTLAVSCRVSNMEETTHMKALLGMLMAVTPTVAVAPRRSSRRRRVPTMADGGTMLVSKPAARHVGGGEERGGRTKEG